MVAGGGGNGGGRRRLWCIREGLVADLERGESLSLSLVLLVRESGNEE